MMATIVLHQILQGMLTTANRATTSESDNLARPLIASSSTIPVTKSNSSQNIPI